MKLKKYFVPCLILVLLTGAWAVSADAAEVRIGIGFALPPYVIRDNDSGLEVEIIREALKAGKHTAKFCYLPNCRLPRALKDGDIDAIAVNLAYDAEKDIGQKLYPSDETLAYQNYAITLAQGGHVIHTLADMAGKRIVTFQNATKYLGPEFAEIVQKSTAYEERADHSQLVEFLYGGRSDVAISDKRIFLYWRDHALKKAAAGVLDLKQPLAFYPVFPLAPRCCIFRDEKLREDFNSGLREILANGTYREIFSNYN